MQRNPHIYIISNLCMANKLSFPSVKYVKRLDSWECELATGIEKVKKRNHIDSYLMTKRRSYFISERKQTLPGIDLFLELNKFSLEPVSFCIHKKMCNLWLRQLICAHILPLLCLIWKFKFDEIPSVLQWIWFQNTLRSLQWE